MKAADLIARKAALGGDLPDAKALKELKEILAYNDTVTCVNRRVSRAEALALLATCGWHGGRHRLQAVCVALGRQGYGKP